jgi:UV DNA damage endonuclease
MKIGYPCINSSIIRNTLSTFRLASYSESRMIQTIKDNLIHLNRILKYNVKNDLLYFRISSDLIPFASHPICKFAWHKFFQYELQQIGDYIKKYNIRISMHPDQFVVLNSPNEETVHNSIRELKYQCNLLDAMCIDETAKVQIHVGGVYGNKSEARNRFIKTYSNTQLVDDSIKKRLVIENDDHLYSLKDCLYIHQQTAIPIVFDSFHHEYFYGISKDDTKKEGKESLRGTLMKATSTWNYNKDGIPLVDFSNQDKRNISNEVDIISRKGKHGLTIDRTLFKNFIKQTEGLDFDLMLEIKDKEKSALKALDLLRNKNNMQPSKYKVTYSMASQG